METITLKRAIQIIAIHGNLDEIFYFFKELGHKPNYKLRDLKDGDVLKSSACILVSKKSLLSKKKQLRLFLGKIKKI